MSQSHSCLSRTSNTEFVLWNPMHQIVAKILSTVLQLVSTLRLRACMNIHRGIERHCTVCNFSRIVHVLVSPRDAPQEAYATAVGRPGAPPGREYALNTEQQGKAFFLVYSKKILWCPIYTVRRIGSCNQWDIFSGKNKSEERVQKCLFRFYS